MKDGLQRKRRRIIIGGLVSVILISGGALALIRNHAQQKKDTISVTREGQYTNSLIKEKSPYLLQHAHNPVDGYPWGEEASEKSRREEKESSLTIGYSTYDWRQCRTR